MVFSSFIFLFRFLPLAVLIYFIAPRKLKNTILFLSSLLFYAWGEPVYIVLMIFSTVVDYIHGLFVFKYIEENNKKMARLFVILSIIINLSLLGIFKYSDFLIGIINSISKLSIPALNLSLPIGISFYTFQTMSYTIDIYRGHALPQKNIISFGAYVSLFPQLIAGPIVQYKTIAKELEGRRESFQMFYEGIRLFITGLGKKILLANNIGLLWEEVSSMPLAGLSALSAWLGILAFTFQIYFDFSGYSDMAMGLGRMFGFHFPRNFDYPYTSNSVTEFWRRWHITLGTWFREYVYIPLGGNRCSKIKFLRNILIVWLLTGIWHGASLNFIAWGLYFGIILLLEKLFLNKYISKIPVIFQRAYTFIVVVISWVIFSFESSTAIISYLNAMFARNMTGLINKESLYLLNNNLILFLILFIGATPIPKKSAQLILDFINKTKSAKSGKSGIWLDTALTNLFLSGILILCIAYLVNASYNPFLYFRF